MLRYGLWNIFENYKEVVLITELIVSISMRSLDLDVVIHSSYECLDLLTLSRLDLFYSTAL
jgi:hypothetical protein